MSHKACLLWSWMLLGLVSCVSAGYGITEQRPDLDGSVIHRTEENWLEGGNGFTIPRRTLLNLQRYSAADGSVSFDLVVGSVGAKGDFLFIQPGESLIVSADGVRMAFSVTLESIHRETDKTYGNAREIAWYSATADQIRAIANARDVQVLVRGNHKVSEHQFTEANFVHFRRFVSEFMGQGSAP